jgi:hypothetical protein
MSKLAALFDALTTLQNVTAGLMDGGLFEHDSEHERPAYNMMASLWNNLGWELCSIKEEVDKRTCATPAEAAAKFSVLLMSSAWGGERECETVAVLAKAVADMEWEIAHPRRAGKVEPVRMTGGQRNG